MSYLEEEKEKAQRRKQLFLQYRAELAANPVFQQLLERTYPTSREGFIEDYVRQKVMWLEMEEFHRTWTEKENLQWVELAAQAIDQILQKKLFDAQCLWRAEQLHLDAVDVTADFKYWEKNIRACPFLEPVEESEVDMYIQYLHSFNYEMELGFMEHWQDHENITDAYKGDDSGGNIPEWYDFHNGRTGLGIYMTLPDVRGEKEGFYMDIWRNVVVRKEQNRVKAEIQAQKDAGTYDERPRLAYYQRDWMKWFVETFEDSDTIEAYRRNQKVSDSFSNNEALENDLDMLGRADRKVPIEGWFDWREAVHKAADNYRKIRIEEALPVAFEQYRLAIDLGLGFAEDHDRKVGWNDGYRKAILDAREANGEPRDFDF